ncbi:MAG: inorganic phosphate transporter [Betaproteobacteria bacterium]|nr:inorganic phosphate transporter [Betaproteobacteria bacterium]
MSYEVLVFLVAVALAFDFMNGFHDAANAIATIVSTRVLRPQWAVAWAAFFNFIAFLIFGVAVAATIGKGIIDADGKGIIDPEIVDHYVIFGALIGAISWNVITWYYGIPSSSSHALIGGLGGAAVAKGGVYTLIVSGFLKTAAAIVLSPALGFVLGIVLMLAVTWVWARSTPRRVDRWFRRLQLISASLYSIGHGGNDAQKTMGIIWMLLISGGILGAKDPLPLWVVFACYGTIALGTLFGGWRIVKTMGQKITKLKPVSGFCAETGGAITLFLATGLGVPVSTTHTITGSIVGVGSVQKLSAVRWGVAGTIVWAWIFTIPCSAFIAAVAWWLAHHFL